MQAGAKALIVAARNGDDSKLQAMVDPTDIHVMPSSQKKKEKADLSHQLMMPPPMHKKRKPDVVLEEDEFSEEIRRIVVRDFFPDLPKLEAQLEWLEAHNNNDLEKIRELRAKFSAVRNPYGRDTPLRSPAVPNPSGTPLTTTSHINHAQESVELTKPKKDKAVGLDDFLSKHNGEDNASFEEILKKEQLKHKQKYWWVFDEVKKAEQANLALTDGKKPLALTSGPKPLAIKAPTPLALHCVAPPALEDKEPIRDGAENFRAPKEIRHDNTRFRVPLSKPIVNAAIDAGSETPVASSSTEKNAYLTTPSMEPGEDLTPLMTWGQIQGTPMVLGPTDTPIDLSSIQEFKIPEPQEREKVARKMDVKLRKRKREQERKRRQSLSRRRNSSIRGTPRNLSALRRSSKRGGGLASMSPAARRLASNLASPMTGGLDFDSQLRASYSRSNMRRASSRRRHASQLSSRRKSSKATPSASPAMNQYKDGQKSKETQSSSITDNLLKM